MSQYFDRVFISEQMGCKKPDKLFYDKVFAEIGEEYRACSIMIGDSLSSDMQGGRNAGIPTCPSGGAEPRPYRGCAYFEVLRNLQGSNPLRRFAPASLPLLALRAISP